MSLAVCQGRGKGDDKRVGDKRMTGFPFGNEGATAFIKTRPFTTVITKCS
jgi:hypothetical protein